MDERRQWIESEHPILSVRQQAGILGLNRSVIYYESRPKALSEGQLGLLRLVDEIYTKYPFFGSRQMSDFISMLITAQTFLYPKNKFMISSVSEFRPCLSLRLKVLGQGPAYES